MNTATGTLSSLWVSGSKKRRLGFIFKNTLCNLRSANDILLPIFYCPSAKVPALFGIDTRMLTKVIRDKVVKIQSSDPLHPL